MSAFATIDDLTLIWGPLKTGETTRATELLDVVSDSLRAHAFQCGRDLDLMISEEPSLASVAKSVTCKVVGRTLRINTDGEPMTQLSQSAGGYTISGSPLVPGGGILIRKSELKELGITRQKYGVFDPYGID